MGWYIAYLIMFIGVCVAMSLSGFGLSSWQYWLVAISVSLAHTFGRLREEK